MKYNTNTHLVDDLEAERDRLLAEDQLASLSGGHHLTRVLVGGRADHHSLHLRVVDELRGNTTATTDRKTVTRKSAGQIP